MLRRLVPCSENTHVCRYNRYITYYQKNPKTNIDTHVFLLAGHSEIIQLSSWNYKLWVLRLWTSLSATWGMATHKVDTSCLLDCFPGWSKCWQDSGKRFFCWNAEAQNYLRGKSWIQLMKQSTTTRLVACGILCTNSITLATSLCDFLIFLWIQRHIVTYSGSLDLLTTGFEE